jgi:hypothetical protein
VAEFAKRNLRENFLEIFDENYFCFVVRRRVLNLFCGAFDIIICALASLVGKLRSRLLRRFVVNRNIHCYVECGVLCHCAKCACTKSDAFIAEA